LRDIDLGEDLGRAVVGSGVLVGRIVGVDWSWIISSRSLAFEQNRSARRS